MVETVREQPKRVKTGKDKKILSFVATAVLFLVSGFLLVSYLKKEQRKEYIPPEFESRALAGIPTPQENYLYRGIETDYGFLVKLASNLYQQEDGSLKVYFTNPIENEVYLMIDIVENESFKSIYRSGVIKPGEYVETLEQVIPIENELTKATIRIYAFETQHWYSEGTVEIDCEIQPW